MDRRSIARSHIKYLIALYILGNSLFFGSTSDARQDFWFNTLLSLVGAFGIIFVYSSILKTFPEKNLYEIAIEVFGRVAGRIVGVLYVLYSLYLATLILNLFAEFIRISSLETANKLTIIIPLLAVCTYAVYNGVATLGMGARLAFFCLFFFIIFTFLAGIPIMDVNRLRPVLSYPAGVYADSAFNLFSTPFGELVLFMAILPHQSGKRRGFLSFLPGVIMGVSLLLVANLRNILILGPTNIKSYFFPSYIAVSAISLGDFLSRIEVLIGINLLLAGTIKICTCLFSSSIGLGTVFKSEKAERFCIPCALFIMTYVAIVGESPLSSIDFISYYRFAVLPVQVIIPILLLIFGRMKKKKEGALS